MRLTLFFFQYGKQYREETHGPFYPRLVNYTRNRHTIVYVSDRCNDAVFVMVIGWSKDSISNKTKKKSSQEQDKTNKFINSKNPPTEDTNVRTRLISPVCSFVTVHLHVIGN